MADIEVNCGHCGGVFEAPEDMAGSVAECPECGKQISIPLPPSPERAKLEVKRDAVITGGKRCPSCGATMAEQDVICIQCGYDTRTGARIVEKPSSNKIAKWLLTIAVLIVLTFLAISVLQKKWAPSATGLVTPPPKTVSASVPTQTTTHAKTTAQTATQAVTATVSSNETAKAEKLAQLTKDYKAALDRKYPLYGRGDAVVLRAQNGRMYRGKFIGLEKESAIIFVDQQRVEVPLKLLDNESRVRVDRDFRDRYIDSTVKKRVEAAPRGA